MMNLADLRREFTHGGFDVSEADPDPIRQFLMWFAAADSAGVPDANAMTLATATSDGVPSARIVLLKGADAKGFQFFTNYQSDKARDLEANPRAALVFYWGALDRQVRVTGTVARVSREVSEVYFRSRPRGARIGAWASDQSRVIPDRTALEERVAEIERKYPGEEVPLPPFWGGYRLAPDTIEFWQGRPSRLHDRIRYTRQPDGDWLIERLSP